MEAHDDKQRQLNFHDAFTKINDLSLKIEESASKLPTNITELHTESDSNNKFDLFHFCIFALCGGLAFYGFLSMEDIIIFRQSLTQILTWICPILTMCILLTQRFRSQIQYKQMLALYQEQIDTVSTQIQTLSKTLNKELDGAREYIHPSQKALISIIHHYNSLRVDCERLQKALELKQGEVNAYEEIRNSRHKYQSRDTNVVKTETEQSNLKAISEHSSVTQPTQLERIDATSESLMGQPPPSLTPIHSDDQGFANKMEGIVNEIELKLLSFDSKSVFQGDKKHEFDPIFSLLRKMKHFVLSQQQYISRLEHRYVQIMSLYQMKYAEVEHKSDLLFQSDQYINDLKEDISDLDYRLGAVMSSAVSNVETRMKAFDEMGVKIQTMEKVIKLVEDTYTNIQQACQDIQESVEKDLYDIIGDSFDDKQHQQCAAMLGNVTHSTDYILKAFDDIGQEMDGVGQFVHPDHKMVERLQLKSIELYEKCNELLKQKIGEQVMDLKVNVASMNRITAIVAENEMLQTVK